MIIVCTHLLGEGHFESDVSPTAGVCCGDDYAYWRALHGAWGGGGTIINVEHDIDVTDTHIRSLIDCPHPLCSWAYECHWVSTGLGRDIYVAGTGARNTHHLRGGEEWADWSAIGLVKIAPEARIGSLRREPWHHLELAVEAAVSRPWHMHWPPVMHHHW